MIRRPEKGFLATLVLVSFFVFQPALAAVPPSSVSSTALSEDVRQKAEFFTSIVLHREAETGSHHEVARILAGRDYILRNGGYDSAEHNLDNPTRCMRPQREFRDDCPTFRSEMQSKMAWYEAYELERNRPWFESRRSFGSTAAKLGSAATDLGLGGPGGKVAGKVLGKLYEAGKVAGEYADEATFGHSMKNAIYGGNEPGISFEYRDYIKDALEDHFRQMLKHKKLGTMAPNQLNAINGISPARLTSKEVVRDYPGYRPPSAQSRPAATVDQRKEIARQGSKLRRTQAELEKVRNALGDPSAQEMNSISADDIFRIANGAMIAGSKKLLGQFGKSAPQFGDSIPHQLKAGAHSDSGSPTENGSTPATTERAADYPSPEQMAEIKENLSKIKFATNVMATFVPNNSNVQAANLVVDFGMEIANAMADGLAGGNMFFAVTIATKTLLMGLQRLFQPAGVPPPTIEEVILKEVRRIQEQLVGVMSHLQNMQSVTEEARKKQSADIARQFALITAFLENQRAIEAERRTENLYQHLKTRNLIEDGNQVGAQRDERNLKNEVRSAVDLVIDPALTLHKDMDPLERALHKTNVRTAANTCLRGAANACDPSSQTRQPWLRGLCQFKSQSTDALHRELRAVTGYDSRPIIPSKLRALDKLLGSDDHFPLDADRLHSAHPVSYAQLKPVIANTIALFKHRDFHSSIIGGTHEEALCKADPDLAKLGALIDLVNNVRTANSSILPQYEGGKFSSHHLLKAIRNYEASLDDALTYQDDFVKSVGVAAIDQVYDPTLSIASQKQKDRFNEEILKNDHFVFPDHSNPTIPYCGGQVLNDVGQPVTTPSLPVSQRQIRDYAVKLIPKEYLMANQILKGSFQWCYEGVGLENESIKYDPKTNEGVHSGDLAFTVRIHFTPPGGDPLDVAQIRIVDKRSPESGTREYFKREYVPVFGADSGGKSIVNLDYDGALDPGKLLSGDSASAQVIERLRKSQELGIPAGFYPTKAFKKVDENEGNHWNRRFDLLSRSWFMDSQNMETTLLDQAGKSQGLIQVLHSKMEAQALRKVVELADSALAAQMRGRISSLEKDVRSQTGPMREYLDRVDAARDRIRMILWMGLGDEIYTNAELADFLDRLVSGDSFVNAIVQHPDKTLDGRSRESLGADFRARTTKLVADILAQSDRHSLVAHFGEIDRQSEDLATVYWDRMVRNPGCVTRLADLPESLQHPFKTDADLKSAVRRHVSNPFSVKGPELGKLEEASLAAFAKLETKILREAEGLSAGDIAGIEDWLRRRFGQDLTPGVIARKGWEFASRMHFLTTKEPKMTPQKAIALLASYSPESLPAKAELDERIVLEASVSGHLKNPQSKASTTARQALDLRAGSPADRIKAMEDARKVITSALERRMQNIAQLDLLEEKLIQVKKEAEKFESRMEEFIAKIKKKREEDKSVRHSPVERFGWEENPLIVLKALEKPMNTNLGQRLKAVQTAKTDMEKEDDEEQLGRILAELKKKIEPPRTIPAAPQQNDETAPAWVSVPPLAQLSKDPDIVLVNYIKNVGPNTTYSTVTFDLHAPAEKMAEQMKEALRIGQLQVDRAENFLSWAREDARKWVPDHPGRGERF
ncbi:MAG: hypothetical protein HYZ71_14545 [Deltaproteobacteria bacterium]|nr:hypothetical protein [Deltaproteobacteria bacterium]